MALQVTCISKDDRQNPYERIQFIGGPQPDGSGSNWRLSQSAAISAIETNKWSFYVDRPAGDRVSVIVARSRFGNKYIKTTSDGDEPNNLLSLLECK